MQEYIRKNIRIGSTKVHTRIHFNFSDSDRIGSAVRLIHICLVTVSDKRTRSDYMYFIKKKKINMLPILYHTLTLTEAEPWIVINSFKFSSHERLLESYEELHKSGRTLNKTLDV